MTNNMKLTIEHNGTTYYGEIATIKSTHLGENDRGFFTAGFELGGDGWGVGAGGSMCLDGKPEYSGGDRTATAYGMDFIRQLLRVAGESEWSKLKGKKVIALRNEAIGWGAMNIGMANIDTGEVFIYSEHAEEWYGKSE